MKTNRLTAFTLFELLLVMILISIIVTILGSTLYNVGGFHRRLADRVNRVGTFKEVQFMISRDYHRTKGYYVNNQTLVFANEVDTVSYSFGEKVLRQQGVRTDSLPLSGTIFANDSITTIKLLFGQRITHLRLPTANSGFIDYQISATKKEEADPL